MYVVLWDTHERFVTKEFGAGFGMGAYHGRGGWRGRMIRRWYTRDRRPVTLPFAYMAAIFRQLGHTVEYAVDDLPANADVYVFHPALGTIDQEIAAMRQLRARHPRAHILVTGVVAYAMPQAFADANVTVVRGEPEQLLWKLDEVLAAGPGVVNVGSVKDLDALPCPDWSPFAPRNFKVNYDFTRFPTALVQSSRGCAFSCNYCPYILVENKVRFREPAAVLEEIQYGRQVHGFRSFKFRDPLFGANRRRLPELIEHLGRLDRKVQFSIETRIDLMPRETLAALRDVGLTAITVGIETPAEDTLRNYRRRPIADDQQAEFIAACRELGIRTAAGFMIGFPEDTPESILAVLRYAKQLNPTYANFNIVTPYPGTEFYTLISGDVGPTGAGGVPWSHYDMYTPVLQYQHLTHEQVHDLHAKCFTSYYTRWPYLFANAHLLWPMLRRLGLGPKRQTASPTPAPAADAPPARRAA